MRSFTAGPKFFRSAYAYVTAVFLCLILWSSSRSGAEGNQPLNREAIERRINQGDDEVFDEIIACPTDFAVQRLSSVIRVYSRAPAGERNDEIVAKAKRALVNVPDHANFYLERIEELTTQSWTGAKRATSVKWLGRLASAGSSEALVALGDLLQDERIPESDEELEELIANIDSLGDTPIDIDSNAKLAASVLTSLELPSAPVKGLAAGSAVGADKLWRDWWADKMQNGSSQRPAFVFSNSALGPDDVQPTESGSSRSFILLTLLGIVVLLIPVLCSLHSRLR